MTLGNTFSHIYCLPAIPLRLHPGLFSCGFLRLLPALSLLPPNFHELPRICRHLIIQTPRHHFSPPVAPCRVKHFKFITRQRVFILSVTFSSVSTVEHCRRQYIHSGFVIILLSVRYYSSNYLIFPAVPLSTPVLSLPVRAPTLSDYSSGLASVALSIC